MKSPSLTDMDEIRRMSEYLAEAEREEFQLGGDPVGGHDQDQATPDPLSFPPIMAGVAGDFAEIFSAVLEPPKHFFFTAYMACLGSVLADKIMFESELYTQVRLYILLLGESADDRKSTAIDKAVKFFSETLLDFQVCWGVGSAEGLQKQMEGNGKLLLCQDEFKSLVSKCKIDSSVLLPCLTTLFESNRYESHTKKTSVKLENAYLSLLAASTIQTYERTWDASFTDIGFNNRLFLVPGAGQRKYAFPHKIPLEEKMWLKDRLRRLLDFVGPQLKLGITPEAQSIFENWYLNMERSLHTKRLDGYAIRWMGLLAVNEFLREITPDIVHKAIALMEWQLKVRKLHDPIDADNLTAKMEERIRRCLAGGPRSDRELKQRTHANRAGLFIFEAAKRNLVRGKEIFFDTK